MSLPPSLSPIAAGSGKTGLRPVAERPTGPATPASTDGAAVAPPAPTRADGAASLSPLGAALRDLTGAPPVDHARVEALRAAIAEGRYQPDPAAIADALLSGGTGR